MAQKARTIWRCQQCGASAPRWMGRCSGCGEFGTFVEELERPVARAAHKTLGRTPMSLAEAASEIHERVPTGVGELDRVLGGGLVRGSLVLIGGEPGIGKSTLLMQVSGSLAESGRSILYVCGEESSSQVAMRASRLGIGSDGILLLPEVDVVAVEQVAVERRPDLLVIDSIQTAFDPELSGAPGSVGQVRAATARLMRVAKDEGITTMIVGHVTKDGAIAGPRVLEHMVDSVLYFEGDRDHAFRVVRAVKNRFGSASEIGIFEMGERGLAGVRNPSALLLGDRGEMLPGSVVMAAMEGSRPLLVEVQALVTPSYLQIPRRLATGVEAARLLQVLAVLERRGGVSFEGHDVYVAVSGGVRIAEPAIDVPLALALLSARADQALPEDLVAFGEIGLTGRVRAVPHAEARLREAARQGFARAFAMVPHGSSSPEGVTVDSGTDVADLAALVCR